MTSSRRRSVCPHDCPSVCALDVEVLDERTIGKVYGAKDHSYTAGVICAKVSRYAERAHHPDRLLTPLRRRQKAKSKISRFDPRNFERCSWDSALDEIGERFTTIIERHGAQALWPFHYAGTMGLVQRDGLDRLRHELGTSLQHSTYCSSLPDAGWIAGAGSKKGADARLMHKSELVIMWGGNPVSTQVNVMHHLTRAKRESSAQFVVIDPYRTKTAEKADMHLMLRPGTDGALACAVMHVLFREDLADRDYLAHYSDDATALEAHLESRTPVWAADITGLSVAEIEAFARLYGSTQRSFLRLGYGFSRSRNGAVNMHAASCLPMITGAWQVEGGGALFANGAIYTIDNQLICAPELRRPDARVFDQSRIGEVLCGNPADLAGGPSVQGLFVQSTNPAVVAPDTRRVLQGLQREDLFTVVHEQFMTETAMLADLILPATMFVEHDDIYKAGAHTHLQMGPRLIEPPGECRSNHDVLCALAPRLGLQHEAFSLSAREVIERTLAMSGLSDVENLLASGGIDLAPEFHSANFLDGFDQPDGRFRFAPDWASLGAGTAPMPSLPDHWEVIDAPSDAHPLRLVAAPARQFLNTSFTETRSAQRMEGEPRVLIHPQDARRFGLDCGSVVEVGNAQAVISLVAKAFEGVLPGTVVIESLWPNANFPGGLGVNALTSAEPALPNGGAVYHDTAVWVRPAQNSADLVHRSTALKPERV